MLGNIYYLLQKHTRLAFIVRHVLPFVFTAIALKLTLLMPNVPANSFFTFFVAACAASAYFGGATAGLLCVFLSAAASSYFTVLPVNSFAIGTRTDAIRFAGFIATALFICWLIARLRSTSEALRKEENALRLSKGLLNEYVEDHAREQADARWLQMCSRGDSKRPPGWQLYVGVGAWAYSASFLMLWFRQTVITTSWRWSADYSDWGLSLPVMAVCSAAAASLMIGLVYLGERKRR